MRPSLFKALLFVTAFTLITPASAQDTTKQEQEPAQEEINIETMIPESNFTLPELEGFQNIYGKHQIIDDSMAYYDEEIKVIKGFYLTTGFAQAALEGVAGHTTKDPIKLEGMRKGFSAVTPRFFFYESRINGHISLTPEHFATMKEKIKEKHLALIEEHKAGLINVIPLEEIPESDDHITTTVIASNGDDAIVICTTTFQVDGRTYYTTAIRDKAEDSTGEKAMNDTLLFIDAFKKLNKKEG